MKRKNSVLKLLFMMTLTLVSALVIVACTPTDTDAADVASAKTALEVGFTAPDTKDSVTGKLTLPTSGDNDVTITWQSSHPSVVSTAGVVTRPANDTSVTLTATLTKGEATDTKNFTVNVKAVEVTTTPQEAIDALAITGDTLELDGAIYTTTSDVVLPTSSLGFTVNWVSTSEALTASGVVTRPAYGEGDERVVLTASIGDVERDFIIDVIAIQDKPAEDILDDAYTALLLTSLATAESLTLATEITVEGETVEETYTVTVTWVSDSVHMNNNGQVDRPVAGSEDAVVNLTATLSYGGETREKEFQVVVYAYTEAFTVVSNVAEAQALYAAADSEAQADGVYVRIQDLSLVMKVSDGLLFTDSEGDILFAFGSQSNAYRDAEVGVLYDVVGALDVYFGAFQISATKNSRKPTELLVQEGDAIVPDFGEEMSIMDLVPATQPAPYGSSNLFDYTPARITAKVMVTSQTDNYGVVLVDTSYTGDGTDLNIGGGSPYENRAVIVYYSSNKDAFLALDGLEVTVDVILYAFRTDRLVHTVLFGGTLEDIQVNVTPEEVVDLVGAALQTDVPQVLSLEKDFELRTSYLGASIQWASSHPELISATGEVTLPATGSAEVTLTATITMGDATKVVEFDITVGQLTIADVLAATRGEVQVTGKVVGFTANNTLVLHDDTGAIALFISGDFRDQLIDAIGDVVTITGTRTAYNGLQQIGSVTAVETSTDAIDTLTVDITSLNWDTETLMPHQNKLVSITGAEVTAVSTDSNGNISATFKVGEKTINMRWDSRVDITGQNVLAFMVVGDIVDIVNAPLGWNNNPQLGYYVADQIDLAFDTHMVTFMDGETTLGTLEVRAGQAVDAFPQASKEGFAFDGWFSDATFDTAWLEADLVNDDVTLYAKFSELTGSLVVETYDFIGLANATSYVTVETSEVVNGLTFTRMNANISASGDYKGIVLGIRTGNSWNSPYLQIDEKIEGAFKVVFNVTNWSGDAGFNLSFADGIYIQTSTDGETWVNSANFKDTWNTDTYGVNNIEMMLEGDVFVRLFVQSAGTQEGTFQLRLIVGSVEIHKMENLEAPVDVTFDPNYGEETATVMTIESGETVTPPVLAERVGFNFLGWFLAEAETAFDFETPITEDMTFEARWEEQVVTLQTIAEVLASEDGDLVNFIGTITGFTPYTSFGNFDAVFMEDETGSIYIHRSSLPETIAIGDKYEVNGELDIYNGLIQIAQAGQVYEFISSGNAVSAPTVVTDLSTLVVADQASQISFSAVVKSVNASGQSLVVTVGEDDITIRSMSNSAEAPINAHFLTAVVGQTVNVTGVHVGWHNGAQLIPSLVSQFEFVEFTDSEKLAQAEADLVLDFDGKEFNMESDIVLPLEGLHGVEVSWAMDPAGAIADGKWFVVTEDTLVTLTATLTLGTELPVDVELQVTVKFVDTSEPVETVLYETGFESSEEFTAATSYNNDVEALVGPANNQWAVRYGTVSTTAAKIGAQSLQMRWYQASSGSHTTDPIYAYTDFATTNATKVSFFAANNGQASNVEVTISIDGGVTWIEAEVFTLTTTSTEFTYMVPELHQSEDVQFKFTIVVTDPIPTSADRLYIDGVKIFGFAA
ncbi:MAG: InlB B-repeat-containing protein [Acholeplasma sp.]